MKFGEEKVEISRYKKLMIIWMKHSSHSVRHSCEGRNLQYAYFISELLKLKTKRINERTYK
jgi:hypothetical protein